MTTFLVHLIVLDKLLAIKVLRDLTGQGLLEVKNLVEKITPETKFRVDVPTLVRLSNLNSQSVLTATTAYAGTSHTRRAFEIMLAPEPNVIDLTVK
jgi:hypothetical protein